MYYLSDIATTSNSLKVHNIILYSKDTNALFHPQFIFCSTEPVKESLMKRMIYSSIAHQKTIATKRSIYQDCFPVYVLRKRFVLWEKTICTLIPVKRHRQLNILGFWLTYIKILKTTYKSYFFSFASATKYENKNIKT